MALACSSASAVPVWRWVDEMGVVHYSDRPMPGAEQIELEGAQSFPSAPLRSAPGTARQSPARQAEAPQAPADRYRQIDVISPSQQETLWNIGGNLDVRVALDPPLQQGHRLDVYLDGALQNVDATSSQFTVPEVFRGVHTLQAVVLDQNDREVSRSLAVTFMVQQTSILNPNNPNAPPRRRN